MYRDITLGERRKRHSRDAIIFANRYTKTNEAQKPILNLVNGFPVPPPPKPLFEVMTDDHGLKNAYNNDDKLFLHRNTLFVAGTSNLQDAWDDLKIPFHLTSHSKRYQDADKLMKANPQIDRVVGHSLGGSVALELQKNYDIETTTYGAPVLDLSKGFGDSSLQLQNEVREPDRFRHPFDPFPFFDTQAKNELTLHPNPHTYGNFSSNDSSIIYRTE